MSIDSLLMIDLSLYNPKVTTQLLTMQNLNILIGKTYALSCAGTNQST